MNQQVATFWSDILSEGYIPGKVVSAVSDLQPWEVGVLVVVIAPGKLSRLKPETRDQRCAQLQKDMLQFAPCSKQVYLVVFLLSLARVCYPRQ